MCYAGFAGCDASRPVFPLVPEMLGITCGMDQKDSTHRALVVQAWFFLVLRRVLCSFLCHQAQDACHLDQKERYVARLLFTCPLCATTGAEGAETADSPQLQLNNKVVHFPVVQQRPIFMVQPVWMTIEIPQLPLDRVIDVPVVHVVQVPQVVDIPVATQRLFPMIQAFSRSLRFPSHS